MTAEMFAQISTVAECFDAKLPDDHVLSTPVIVVSVISDVPDIPIDGVISSTETRISCEVQALDITTARAKKKALIAALQNWRGGGESVTFESGGPELYDPDLVPPRYCLPVDFMVMSAAQ